MEIDPEKLLQVNLEASIVAKQEMITSGEILLSFKQAAEAVLQSYKKGGRLYIAGNGGSAADAQHLAAEFVSKLTNDRAPLPAEALTVDTSILTAIGNDYGYEKVFSRQIEGKMQKDDVFLAFTTSGDSINILEGLKTCQSLGLTSVAFSGRGGGLAKSLADYCVVVPGSTTATIQELHIVLAHTLCGYIESRILGADT